MVSDTNNGAFRYLTCGGKPSPTPAPLPLGLTAAPTLRPTPKPTSGPSPPTKRPTSGPTSPTAITPAPSNAPVGSTTGGCSIFPPSPYVTLYNSTVTPGQELTDGTQVVVGIQFTSSVAGTISAIRFYRAALEPVGTHTGRIWNTSAGSVLLSVKFSDLSCPAESWSRQVLDAPYPILANTQYTVGIDYLTYYGQTVGGTSAVYTSGPLTTGDVTHIPSGRHACW